MAKLFHLSRSCEGVAMLYHFLCCTVSALFTWFQDSGQASHLAHSSGEAARVPQHEMHIFEFFLLSCNFFSVCLEGWLSSQGLCRRSFEEGSEYTIWFCLSVDTPFHDINVFHFMEGIRDNNLMAAVEGVPSVNHCINQTCTLAPIACTVSSPSHQDKNYLNISTPFILSYILAVAVSTASVWTNSFFDYQLNLLLSPHTLEALVVSKPPPQKGTRYCR